MYCKACHICKHQASDNDAVVEWNVRAPTSFIGCAKPRVIVDFQNAGVYNYIVIDCETVEERDALAVSTMAEIEAALGARMETELEKEIK